MATRADLETPHGPFSPATKARLILEVASTFPRARLAARGDDDIRRALANLRGSGSLELPDGDDPSGRELLLLGQRLGQAVARTMRYLPGDTRCLTQSLVLIRMLARRGLGGTLVIGVTPDGGFSAHAWVELSGVALLPPREDVFSRLAEL